MCSTPRADCCRRRCANHLCRVGASTSIAKHRRSSARENASASHARPILQVQQHVHHLRRLRRPPRIACRCSHLLVQCVNEIIVELLLRNSKPSSQHRANDHVRPTRMTGDTMPLGCPGDSSLFSISKGQLRRKRDYRLIGRWPVISRASEVVLVLKRYSPRFPFSIRDRTTGDLCFSSLHVP